ncbi:MAG: hypothetical protein HFG36_05930 [Eubacterium sp.]|nr:hypothetical protein [Eubacterium sp.]
MNVTDRTDYSEHPGMLNVDDRSQRHGNTKKKPSIQGSQSRKGVSKKYTDVAELSEEGKALARAFQKMNEKRKQMAQKTQKTQKKKKKSYGALARALAIARRIMKGEKVPPKDENFLFRFNSDLYLKAKMMAAQNVKPKKHKSLLEKMQEEDGISVSISSHQSSSEGSGDSSEGSDSEETEE